MKVAVKNDFDCWCQMHFRFILHNCKVLGCTLRLRQRYFLLSLHCCVHIIETLAVARTKCETERSLGAAAAQGDVETFSALWSHFELITFVPTAGCLRVTTISGHILSKYNPWGGKKCIQFIISLETLTDFQEKEQEMSHVYCCWSCKMHQSCSGPNLRCHLWQDLHFGPAQKA